MASARRPRTSRSVRSLRFLREAVAHCWLPVSSLDDLAGLGVLDGEHANVRQRLFARVVDVQRHEVMAAIGLPHRPAQSASARPGRPAI